MFNKVRIDSEGIPNLTFAYFFSVWNINLLSHHQLYEMSEESMSITSPAGDTSITAAPKTPVN